MSNVKKYLNIAKKDLFFLCRSITGIGVRKTLKIIKKNFPNLQIKSIKSGTKVFDWKIPPEWNIYKAYVMDKYKNIIIDYKINNLHIVNYSIPQDKIISKKDLLLKLHYDSKLHDAIPYKTSYYEKNWGFCVTKRQRKKIISKYRNSDKFRIKIKTNLNKKGNLNYAELFLKGKSKQEILISTYICHPSMANNELSGPIISMSLIDYFKKKKLEKSLRFIFVPETIGAIGYLHKNLNNLKKM